MTAVTLTRTDHARRMARFYVLDVWIGHRDERRIRVDVQRHKLSVDPVNDSQLQVKPICVVLAILTALDDQRRAEWDRQGACSPVRKYQARQTSVRGIVIQII
jgi:hypothetical protein